MSEDKPQCQHVGCSEDGEFEIHDRGCPNDARVVACTVHVGDLLGHTMPAPENAEDRWEVVGL